MLKMKMQRLTSVIITSMTVASGSTTKPSWSDCWPKVNQAKFWTTRNPGVLRVEKKTKSESNKASTWPAMARPDAKARRDLFRDRIARDGTSGTAGMSQTWVVLQVFILGATENAQ